MASGCWIKFCGSVVWPGRDTLAHSEILWHLVAKYTSVLWPDGGHPGMAWRLGTQASGCQVYICGAALRVDTQLRNTLAPACSVYICFVVSLSLSLYIYIEELAYTDFELYLDATLARATFLTCF